MYVQPYPTTRLKRSSSPSSSHHPRKGRAPYPLCLLDPLLHTTLSSKLSKAQTRATLTQTENLVALLGRLLTLCRGPANHDQQSQHCSPTLTHGNDYDQSSTPFQHRTRITRPPIPRRNYHHLERLLLSLWKRRLPRRKKGESIAHHTQHAYYPRLYYNTMQYSKKRKTQNKCNYAAINARFLLTSSNAASTAALGCFCSCHTPNRRLNKSALSITT